jgi:2'-5' RNA ligase
MRIFVGLDLDDKIRERIARFIDEVSGLARDVRWVSAESLHITLKFIGEKPDPVVEQAKEHLAAISKPGFEIAFRGCGFFPTPKSARVFWIGIEAAPALAKLTGEIENVLTGIVIPKETREFSPHLTLARSGSGAPSRKINDKPNQRFAALQGKLAQLPTPDFGTMAAREFFLYRSQLSNQGPRYTKLAHFELLSGGK